MPPVAPTHMTDQVQRGSSKAWRRSPQVLTAFQVKRADIVEGLVRAAVSVCVFVPTTVDVRAHEALR